MRVSLLAARVFAVFTVARGASVQSEASGTSALQALVERRLPQSLHSAFEFNIYSSSSGSADSYTVSQAAARRISINATSTSALSRGLLVYLRSLGTDIFWTSDTFSSLPPSLPHLTAPLSATTWAQIRYMFNVVTYSYTTAFWTWTRWEYLLDWCSLHGINMPLAIGGQEYVWREVYRDFGVADADIYDWFAGPAFHSWHRMGNLHSSWGADNAKHPTTPSWIDAQWALQLRIVTRMVALGMTPVLPGSAGFIPPALHTILGGDLLTASMWENLPVEYTEDTALDPTWDTFNIVQESFIKKQYELYGNWTSHHYSLDLFNELSPYSLNSDYLISNTAAVIAGLRAADSEAIWVMQGWLFVSAGYWNETTITALLAGAQPGQLLILDLFSEATPDWENTNGYYGHQWVWNLLHDYGGNQGLYGDLEHYASEPLRALSTQPDTMVGMGLTMEGMNGNHVVYELTLDTAWQSTPIDVPSWVEAYAARRYGLKSGTNATTLINQAWSILRTSAYGNPDPQGVTAVIKSIVELVPATSGLDNRSGHHPTILTYDPADVVKALALFKLAVDTDPSLLKSPLFANDYVDVTRQVLVNAFIPQYQSLIAAWNSGDTVTMASVNASMQHLISDLDAVLATNENFIIAPWISLAKSYSNGSSDDTKFLEFEYRNQISVWGPANTEAWALDRYATKQLSGVVRGLYAPSWSHFVDWLTAHPPSSYNSTAWLYQLLALEQGWQTGVWGTNKGETWGMVGDTRTVITFVWTTWKPILQSYYNQTF